MFVAKVTGSLVSTQKVDAMVGYKLLVVEPYRLDSETRSSLTTTGRTFVAVDSIFTPSFWGFFHCDSPRFPILTSEESGVLLREGWAPDMVL